MDNEEMKKVRFIKIAENRTNRILDTIKLLGNCANKNNYLYTEDQVKQIFTAIDQELKNCKQKFIEAQSNKKEFKFRGDK